MEPSLLFFSFNLDGNAFYFVDGKIVGFMMHMQNMLSENKKLQEEKKWICLFFFLIFTKKLVFIQNKDFLPSRLITSVLHELYLPVDDKCPHDERQRRSKLKYHKGFP